MDITVEDLDSLVADQDRASLEQLGGVEGIARKLQVDISEGLRPDRVSLLREKFGENRLPEKKRKSCINHFIDALKDLILIILIVAGFVSIIVGAAVGKDSGDWIQGIAILLAVVVVTGVGSIQNHAQDKRFESLNKVKQDRKVPVLRAGEEQMISIYDVVVGDVFIFQTGEIMPCDGLFLQGSGVKVNESAMTGESKEIKKNKNHPFLLSGSRVEHGAGRMLVLNVGVHSSYGKIVKQLETEEPPPTPLQERLDKLAKHIGFAGIGAGILTFAVLLIIWLAQDGEKDATDALQFFVLGVTIAVVAVPEGLPLAVTLSLAFSVKKMLVDKNLVREMRACETMGSATTICSDKTGTLTENRMSVTRIWVGGKAHGVEFGSGSLGGSGTDLWKLLVYSIALNSDAHVKIEGNSVEFEGNKTEGSLLFLVDAKLDSDYKDLRKRFSPYIYRENFSSQRKRMTTVVDDTILPSSNSFLALTKGASEKVLEFCTTYLDEHGQERAMSPQDRANFEKQINTMASTGLRTLGLAYKRLPKQEFPSPQQEEAWAQCFAEEERDSVTPVSNTQQRRVETEMTLLAIAGIKDPVRPQVPKAVADCKSAGIVVRMVTGDNLLTAQQIARECGILPEGDHGFVVMEGHEFRHMREEDRLAMLPRLRVLARSSPMDKHLLVTNLQALGEVVSVTGDGTNDAPALRAAHVGLAMNIAGTEVAKEASKIVILDDNFASIAMSVLWGRAIFENIRKFLVFQLTINVVALLATFVVACTNQGSTSKFPITPVQLLWVNLIMDSFAALALATEPPDPALMKEQPHGKKEPLITKTMWKYIFGHGMYQTALILLLTMLEEAATELFDAGFETRTHYTCIFNTFVWLQVFNKLNARKIRDQLNIFDGLLESKLALSMLAIIILGQVFLVEIGAVAEAVTSTVPLSWSQWLISIGLGATSIPLGYLLRFIPTEKKHRAPQEESVPLKGVVIKDAPSSGTVQAI